MSQNSETAKMALGQYYRVLNSTAATRNRTFDSNAPT